MYGGAPLGFLPFGVLSIATEEVPPPPPVYKIKYYNGTVWLAKPVKYYNGSAWVEKPIKYYNGSSWS